MHLGRCNFA